jgi:hypothetical protein
MSLWERLKARFADAPDRERAPSPDSRPARQALEAGGAAPRAAPAADRRAELAALTDAEALAALRASRGGPGEAEVLSALSGRINLDEALAVEVAERLVVRGEEARAMELLEPHGSGAALMLLSDLAAARGETARALGAIERVLARDLSAPGAAERHAELSRRLGAPKGPTRRLDEATLLAAAPTDTPFRVEREVARGGAGSVYEAFDEVLGRKVAFKVYHGGAEDRGALEREVRLAVKLAGSGVVRVYDASPEAGWVALEWAAQGSLRDWLRGGRARELWPIGPWALPVARALAAIHEAGFVHADVKPTNVLLNAVDAPLLTDFGIARAAGAPSAGGSAGYVSPERLCGALASPLDDVYGFGRTVEDVLAAAEVEASPGLAALVRDCVGPAATRPSSGAQLVERLAALEHP